MMGIRMLNSYMYTDMENRANARHLFKDKLLGWNFFSFFPNHMLNKQMTTV